MSEYDLDGKVAVITGASRGIGRAIAHRFAMAGASVVVSSRKLAGVQAVADEIQAAGGRALAVAAHVGDGEAVDALVARTVETFGRVDVAVANAATNPHFGPLLSADDGQWLKILDTNLLGAVRLARAAVPHMESQGGGKLIVLASAAGQRPAPGMGVYGVSKAALIQLTRQLALELGPANVQANAIAPGVIETRFSRVLWQTPQIAEPMLARLPLGRFGQPDDVAGLALYLASPAADYITGAVLSVDGGMDVVSGMG